MTAPLDGAWCPNGHRAYKAYSQPWACQQCGWVGGDEPPAWPLPVPPPNPPPPSGRTPDPLVDSW